ncbi:PP2C family protein-serine/threonine phosphatase [Roseimaritima ulvae]|nr:PP2C family protein-serine/threonine phosphatase [Roseimaritima ulvae]
MHSAHSAKRPLETPMNCMEVCGGHVDGSRHLQRPGLDVSISSHSQQDIDAGGGDLHLISSCASGRITRMLLADVCGFGPLFRDLAARLADVMKRNVNSIQQTRSVRQMSEQLAAASEQGGFASTLLSTYFAPTRTLSICNAGHPPPMVFRANAKRWELVKHYHSGFTPEPVAPGLLAPAEYGHVKLSLNPEDMFLSYSNSLTECRGKDGTVLGVAGLKNLLEQLDTAASETIPQRLIEVIRGEHSDNLLKDEATISLCRVTNHRVPWKDNVLAPFRLLRSVSDRTTFT